MVDMNARLNPVCRLLPARRSTSNTVLDKLSAIRFPQIQHVNGLCAFAHVGFVVWPDRDYGGASNATAGFTLPDQIHWPGNVHGETMMSIKQKLIRLEPSISLAGAITRGRIGEIRDGATKSNIENHKPCA